MTRRMAELGEELDGESVASRSQARFLSVDPDFDRPDVLRDYGRATTPTRRGGCSSPARARRCAHRPRRFQAAGRGSATRGCRSSTVRTSWSSTAWAASAAPTMPSPKKAAKISGRCWRRWSRSRRRPTSTSRPTQAIPNGSRSGVPRRLPPRSRSRHLTTSSSPIASARPASRSSTSTASTSASTTGRHITTTAPPSRPRTSMAMAVSICISPTRPARTSLYRNLGGGRFEDITARAGVAVGGPRVASARRLRTSTTTAMRICSSPPCARATSFSGTTAAAGSQHHRAGRRCRHRRSFLRRGVLRLRRRRIARSVRHQCRQIHAKRPAAPSGWLVGQFRRRVRRPSAPRAFRDVDPVSQPRGRPLRGRHASSGLVHTAWSGEATPFDYDADGRPDLYVAAMQGHDEVWSNLGGGRFQNRGRQMFRPRRGARWA